MEKTIYVFRKTAKYDKYQTRGCEEIEFVIQHEIAESRGHVSFY